MIFATLHSRTKKQRQQNTSMKTYNITVNVGAIKTKKNTLFNSFFLTKKNKSVVTL